MYYFGFNVENVLCPIKESLEVLEQTIKLITSSQFIV